MSYLHISFFVLMLLFSSLTAHNHDHRVDEFLSLYKDIDLSITEGSVLLSNKYDNSEYVEITENYDLYVNGEKIILSDDQQQLVSEYYDLLESIVEYAKDIGLDGARIGVAGAKIGLKALAGAMKAIFTEYENEKLEQDLESEGEKIEDMAKILEDKVEDLEHLARKLEKTHNHMREVIPQLSELGWF